MAIGGVQQLLEDRLVPKVHTIKGADGGNAAAMPWAQVVQTANQNPLPSCAATWHLR